MTSESGMASSAAAAGQKRPRAASPARAALVWEELPSDAALALESLRPFVLGAFPLPVFPLAVLSGHVGAASTLTLRAELAALVASGTVRELHLLNGEEVVVVSSSDLHAYLRQQREAGSSASSASSSSSSSRSSASGSASSSSSAVRGRAFDFFASLMAHHPTSHVSDTDIAVSYREWLKEEAAAVGRGGGGGAALKPAGAAGASGAMQRLRAAAGAAAGAGAGAGFGLEQALKELLSLGLLLRHSTPDASAKSYTFGVPGGAQLALYLKEGREELLARLRKAPGRQLPREHVLTKVRLRSSPFPALIHLRDALGRGRATVHHLSDGPYVRWVAQ